MAAKYDEGGRAGAGGRTATGRPTTLASCGDGDGAAGVIGATGEDEAISGGRAAGASTRLLRERESTVGGGCHRACVTEVTDWAQLGLLRPLRSPHGLARLARLRFRFAFYHGLVVAPLTFLPLTPYPFTFLSSTLLSGTTFTPSPHVSWHSDFPKPCSDSVSSTPFRK